MAVLVLGLFGCLAVGLDCEGSRRGGHRSGVTLYRQAPRIPA